MAIIESFAAKAVTTGLISAGALGGAVAITQSGEGISGADCTTMDERVYGESIEKAYTDPSVKTIQNALINSDAIDSILGGADGNFDAISCTALDVFQEKNGLVNDLRLGPQTMGALGISIRDLIPASSAEYPPSETDLEIGDYNCRIDSEVLFQIGDKDGVEDIDDIKFIQRSLNNAGYYMPADGDFGPITKDGLLNFQDEQQIGTDCVVGKITASRLVEFADPLEGQSSTLSDSDATLEQLPKQSTTQKECSFSVLSKKETQRLLEENGITDGSVCEAVWQFQKTAGLFQDGQVGPQTALTLIKNADNSCNIYGTISDDCVVGIQMNGNNGRVFVVEDGEVIRQIEVARFGNPERENGSSTTEGQFPVQRTAKGEYVSTNCIDDNGNGYVCMWDPIFFNGGMAVHGTENPGSPNGSLGCIGVSKADSQFIYAQYEAGNISKVVVVDFQRN